MSTLKPKLLTTLKDYSKEQFFKDITAGIIVAIIALPLSIALAIASGVSPEKGLYTAIIAGFLISLFGGSRVLIGGPTGAFMVIVYGIVVNHGVDGLIMATFMAGIILILMGVFKLGGVIKYIPYPITVGFTSGIAITIFSSQIKDFFGLTVSNVPAEFIAKWKVYAGAFHTVNIWAVLVGGISLGIIIFWPKVNKKIPGAFVALVVSAIIVKLFNLDVATIGSKFGTISSTLPMPTLPAFHLDKIPVLIGPAFTIAILGAIESLLAAVVSDGMIGGKHRSNMELVAQGIGNMGSALFGGIPATGAIARTVANVKNGGRTPVAGIVHAIVLLLIMVIFMPLAKMIPLSCLAAILIVVSYNMSEWREFKNLMSSPKSDILVLVATFSITVMVDLVKAIEIGMILSAFLFMRRMTEVSNVNSVELDASEEQDDNANDFDRDITLKNIPKNIQVYEINGPFFFGAADKFLEVLNGLGERSEYLIVRMRNVPAVDATAVHAFNRMIDMCESHSVKLIITGLKGQPLKVIKRTKIYDRVGKDAFLESVEDALNFLK